MSATTVQASADPHSPFRLWFLAQQEFHSHVRFGFLVSDSILPSQQVSTAGSLQEKLSFQGEDNTFMH